ncbi:hypothetical protein PQX77_016147 [Marasmius sp. AFHP31]|nr:hypothetical protein PQX77_016147 [Marasmius sp. AFHP31]
MSSTSSSSSERTPLLSSKSFGLKGLFRNTITSDDRHVISQFLLDAEKEMKECQAEMNRLRSAMHQLENRRNGLKKTMAKCRSLLAPVHRLPAEILAIIFSFCSQPNDLTRPSRFPVVLQIAQVCGRWRNVGLENPSLWSSIRILLKYWKDKPRSLTTLTELFMERSKVSPLELELHFYADDASESDLGHGSDSEHPFAPVLAALSLETVVAGNLSNCTSQHYPPGKNAFSSTVSTDKPFIYSKSSVWCPSLHSLSVGPECFLREELALPWHQLKELTIRFSFSPRALWFIALHPYLESLTLFRVGGKRDNRSHLISDTIRQVHAIMENQEDANMLSDMTLPALTSLTMEAAPEKLVLWNIWGESVATDFLIRSGCSLTSLSIKWIPITDHQIIRLLEQTPTLSSLSIEETSKETPNAIVTGVLLRRLIVEHEDSTFQSGRTLLPSLTDLTMVIRAQGLVEQEIFDAVSSRQIADPLRAKEFGVECLRSVSVTVMGGDAAEYSMRSLECYRDTGLRLLVGHRPL